MAWMDDNVLRPESAGIFGAVLGLVHAPGGTWRERMFNLGAGVGAAWFLTPWVLELFSIQTNNGRLGLAFVVGLIGMNIVSKIIEQSKQLRFEDVREWLPFMRKGPPKE